VSASVAVLRIAGRESRRSPWRSLLVIAMIAVPVAGMVIALAWQDTATLTAEQIRAEQMGTADLLVQPATAAGAAVPAGWNGTWVRHAAVRLSAGSRRVTIEASAMDAADPLTHGMLVLGAGRLPGRGEIALSPSLASRLRTAVGETIGSDLDGSLRVTGLVSRPTSLDTQFALVAAATVAPARASDAEVLLRLPAGVTPAAGAAAFAADGSSVLTREQAAATARQGLTDAANRDIVSIGALALIESGLFAAAAMTVSTRRNRRSLGLLAAVGAEPRHLFRRVAAGGLVLGVGGAAVGVAFGLLGCLVSIPWLDELTNHHAATLRIPWSLVAIGAALGAASCLLAAIVPAWQARRGSVMESLGARRPHRVATGRVLGRGVVLIAGGSFLYVRTAVGADVWLLPALGIAIATVGFGSLAPLVLVVVDRAAAGLPPGLRVGLRRVTRGRSRNTPLVAALVVVIALVVTVATTFLSHEANDRRAYAPQLDRSQVAVQNIDLASSAPVRDALRRAVPRLRIVDVGFLAARASTATDARLTTDTGALLAIGDPATVVALNAERAAPALAAGRIAGTSMFDASASPTTPVLSPSRSGGVQVATMPAATFRYPFTGTRYDFPDPFGVALVPPALVAHLPADVVHGYLVVGRAPTALAAAERAAIGRELSPLRVPYTVEVGYRSSRNLQIAVALGVALLAVLLVAALAAGLAAAEGRDDERVIAMVGGSRRARRTMAAAQAGSVALVAALLGIPAGLWPLWIRDTITADLGSATPVLLAILIPIPLITALAAYVGARPAPPWRRLAGARR
jgi:putative ABC transport system permease protein